jgi:ParB-like chromosome segregation protein Spo0J
MVEVVRETVMVPITEIKPYKNNPRINDATVEKLVQLLPKVGFNVPLLLDRENVVVKGHARLAAAIRLNMTSVPCCYTDADPESIRLDRLADNRVGEFSHWDELLLPAEIAALGPAQLELAGSLDLLQPADLRPLAPPRPDDEPFITPEDERATASMPDHEYGEVACTKCGQPVFYRVR